MAMKNQKLGTKAKTSKTAGGKARKKSPAQATATAASEKAKPVVESRRVQAEIVAPPQSVPEQKISNFEFSDEEAYLNAELDLETTLDIIPDLGGSTEAEDKTEVEAEDVVKDLVEDLIEAGQGRAPSAGNLPVVVHSSAPAVSEINDPVATYLAEIRQYKLLTRDEEQALAIRYRESGDSAAAEALVTSNLRFVVKIAAEYSRFGAKLIDLIQEGNVGLMHAVREFNPYKGVRLITYAVWWIRGYIQEYLMRQYSLVRIGTTQNQRKLFYRLQREKGLLDSLGKEHDIPLLSSRLGVSEDEVKTMAQRLSGRDVSLSQPLDSFSRSTSLLDLEASPEAPIDERLDEAENLDLLRRNINLIRPKLNEKELYLLDNRVLADEPLTLQEIGERFGVTREAVRQLESRLISKIRTAFIESAKPPMTTVGDGGATTETAASHQGADDE